jgi:tartrate dehydrogenase/decarboxylase/D-malate dehydrogenase
VRDAVSKVLAEGAVKTPDLGGKATTTQMGDAVVAAIG